METAQRIFKNNLQLSPVAVGVILMIGATSTIPIVDGVAKHLSAAYTVIFIAWARCLSGSILSLPFALSRRHSINLKKLDVLMQVIRAVFLLLSMLLYYAAISIVPLADALGAYFVSPIVVTLLSRIILKERLTPVRLAAVIVGFLGVSLVIKPSLNMDPGMLYALGAGVLFACYIVLTRIVNRAASTSVTLSFQYTIGALLLTPLVWSELAVPSTTVVFFIVLMGVFSVISHTLEVSALRFTQASILSPLMYTEIVSATLIGYLFFNDFPDKTILFGVGIIIVTGIIMFRNSENKETAHTDASDPVCIRKLQTKVQ